MKCVWGTNNLCSTCGRRRPKTSRSVYAECGRTQEDSRWLDCPHRGDVLSTITGRVAGCGCQGSIVEVFRCDRFPDPVIKAGHPPCMDTIREQVPGFTGRTCRECSLKEVG